MYKLTVRHGAQSETLRSEEIARMCNEAWPNHPQLMEHLCAIEHIEARGIAYSGQDFDVLMAAYRFAVEGDIFGDFQLANDPPKHTPARFQSQDKTRQRVLVEGMDCLPGQQDLF